MSQPDRNQKPKDPPKFTKPVPRQKSADTKQDDVPPPPSSNGAASVQREFAPPVLAAPEVEVPNKVRSPRTAQLNVRVTEEFRDWWSRQLRFIGAETGLRDNQLNAIVVQHLRDTVGDIRYKAMLLVGMVEAPPAEPVDLDDD